MATRKPRILIIGAGMAGLSAANRLYNLPIAKQLFDICVIEGGNRIGGRIHSSEFSGDRIEQGATWIHGIQGSPIYEIAQQSGLLHSPHPWEGMHGIPEHPLIVAEGGHLLNPSFVDPISTIFKILVDITHGKVVDGVNSEILNRLSTTCGVSVGSFLRKGLEVYRGFAGDSGEEIEVGNWGRRMLEEAVFAMHENIERSVSAADDLETLDFAAEKDYTTFPGEDITIAGGYSSVIQRLACGLPLQLGKKVERIEWQCDGNDDEIRPVKLHLADGSTVWADHVIITVSLGVLKNGIQPDSRLFDPPLPSFKTDAIFRLGYGVVDKVFLHLPSCNREIEFPFLQMVFHQSDSDFKSPEIPWWIRRTSLLYPIYRNSRVALSWFTGQEALELEALSEEDVIDGFSTTVSNLISPRLRSQMTAANDKPNSGIQDGQKFEFANVLRTQWGSDPLFMGSYSYVAVGSSGDDMDILAEPLPQCCEVDSSPQLQILFAGEATHRTHYSTTHGAYLSGLREANRILKHYNLVQD